MAAANESQGLKIAVAAFIALTVILTVSSYFLYTNGASAEARRESAEETPPPRPRRRAWRSTEYDAMRNKIGVKASEFDPANEEITAHMKKIDERLNAILEQVNAAVQKAQQNGARAPSWTRPSKTCRRRSRRFNPSRTRPTCRRSTGWRS